MSYTYSISSYSLPSAEHRAFPFQEPELSYKHIHPQGKQFLVSVMAYVPGFKPAADLVTDTLENFFDPEIMEELFCADTSTLASAVENFITEHAGWFFRHIGIPVSDAEYAVLFLDTDSGSFHSFAKGDCVICKGPLEDSAHLCNLTDWEEGSISADSCFMIANSTIKHMMQENPTLAKVINRAMCFKNDDEYLDIAAEAVTELKTPSRLMNKQDAFLCFIPIYES